MHVRSNSEAIILKKRSLLQVDELLTCFTFDFGKIKVIAKGIKKITSRRAPHIQTGNLVELTLTKRTSTYYLQQSKLISGFSNIRLDTRKTNYLYTFFFIIDRLLPEEQQDTQVYEVTKLFLITMGKPMPFSQVDFTSYINQLLLSLGYTAGQKTLSELLMYAEEIINEKIPINSMG